MKTFQGFIIWGHGCKYIEEILNIIRSYPDIEIKKIFKRKKLDLQNFINHVYALDEYSREHIKEKTKFLLTVPNEIFFIVICDNNTIIKNKPNNNHQYLYNETLLKWKIRLLFNPRIKKISNDIVNTAINNLDKVILQQYWVKEITHNHIIHCTDSENEFAHLLKFFKFDFNNPDTKKYLSNTEDLSKFKIIKIKISNILVNTCLGDEMELNETPHYLYLNGKKEEYRQYILKYLGEVIKDDHLPEKYDRLIKKFDYGKIINGIPSYILVKNAKKNGKFVTIDGVHRLAILKKSGIEKIHVYIDETNNS